MEKSVSVMNVLTVQTCSAYYTKNVQSTIHKLSFVLCVTAATAITTTTTTTIAALLLLLNHCYHAQCYKVL